MNTGDNDDPLLAGKTKLYASYKAALQRRQVILLTTAGSKLIGMQQGLNSDSDEMGVCLETISEAVGFEPFNKPDIYRTAEDRTGQHDAPSGPGDIDLALYNLRSYVKLVMGGNPNLMNILFVTGDNCLIKTTVGEELQALAPKIVSRMAGKAYLGYLQAQRGRLVGTQGQRRVNRPDLIEKFGYDTKYAMHMVRLGLQGVELLTTGKLSFPMSEQQLKTLKIVRSGEQSLNWCLLTVKGLENDLQLLIEKGDLRPTPDYDAIETWLLDTYRKSWTMHATA